MNINSFLLKKYTFLFVLALSAVWLAACGSLEVGIETAVPQPTRTTAQEPVPQPTLIVTEAADGKPTPTAATGEATFDTVQIFLVALDDDGRRGRRIGCGDSLIAVERAIAPTTAPLRAALTELLSLREHFYGDSGLYNALAPSNLEVGGINIENRKATVHLTGELMLVGTCEDPRIAAQIEETVLQFHTIDEVDIFINGDLLREYISGAGPLELGGLHVAYVKEGNVWLWRERQERVALTTAAAVEEVKLSDDGRMVAFIRNGELWVVNTNGLEERLLVSAADLAAMTTSQNGTAIHQFAWTPGNPFLAFNTRQVFDGPGLLLNNDLRVINANSGEPILALPSGSGGAFYYSPDGEQIALVTPDEISLVNADGGNRRPVLTYTPVTTYSEYAYYARPIWAPDGRELRVAIPPADPLAQPPQSTQIFAIASDGTPAQQIGGIEAASLFHEPAFSPDWAYIAYLYAAADNQFDLQISSLSGEPVTYARAVQELNGWSPDSAHFIFSTGLETRQMQLGSIHESPRPLVDSNTAVVGVRWVDAERFIYLNQMPGGWNIVLGHINGSSQTLDSATGFPPAYDFQS